jgi:hypothetical protein
VSEDMDYELDASATSELPARDLMLRIRRSETWPRWQPEIIETDGPELVGPGDVVTGKARMLGFGVYGHSTTVDVGTDHLEEDVLVGVRMRVRYEVVDDGLTRIRHRLHLYPLQGPAGKTLGVLLRWRLKRMQKLALRNLAQPAEPSP